MIELVIVDNKNGTRGTTYYLETIRNKRGEAVFFRALDVARNEQGMVVGPYIDCKIQPVHESSCGVFRKRCSYTCNCGAREMFDRLINETGEVNVVNAKAEETK